MGIRTIYEIAVDDMKNNYQVHKVNQILITTSQQNQIRVVQQMAMVGLLQITQLKWHENNKTIYLKLNHMANTRINKTDVGTPKNPRTP